ncbi:hypothetical protein LTR95_000024 [Oleoguttula sp. CCFEE 5521]
MARKGRKRGGTPNVNATAAEKKLDVMFARPSSDSECSESFSSDYDGDRSRNKLHVRRTPVSDSAKRKKVRVRDEPASANEIVDLHIEVERAAKKAADRRVRRLDLDLILSAALSKMASEQGGDGADSLAKRIVRAATGLAEDK